MEDFIDIINKQLIIYPVIVTSVLFLLNILFFRQKNSELSGFGKKLDKINILKVIFYFILMLTLILPVNIYGLIIYFKIKSGILDTNTLETFINANYLLVFTGLLITAIVIKNIVLFIGCNFIIKDIKNFKKVFILSIIGSAIGEVPAIMGLTYIFSAISTSIN